MRRKTTRAARWLAYLPAVAWAAALLFAGGQSDLPAPPLAPGADKLAHFAAYGVLGFLLGLAWDRRDGRRVALLLVASASLVGALDELHQARVPGRTAEWGDWLADTLGAGTGFGAALLLRARRRGPGNR